MHGLGKLLQAVRARQGSFKTGSAITIVFNGAAIVVMGVGSILITRALGPEQAGYLVWSIAGTTTIALFADTLGSSPTPTCWPAAPAPPRCRWCAEPCWSMGPSPDWWRDRVG